MSNIKFDKTKVYVGKSGKKIWFWCMVQGF